MIRFMYRKPIFPVICVIEGNIFVAMSDMSLLEVLSDIILDPDKIYDLVDSTAESFVFTTKHMIVSPIITLRHWTKKEIVSTYNGRKNSIAGESKYSEKSLSAKRVDRVFGDIVDLLLKSSAKGSAP